MIYKRKDNLIYTISNEVSQEKRNTKGVDNAVNFANENYEIEKAAKVQKKDSLSDKYTLSQRNWKQDDECDCQALERMGVCGEKVCGALSETDSCLDDIHNPMKKLLKLAFWVRVCIIVVLLIFIAYIAREFLLTEKMESDQTNSAAMTVQMYYLE